MAILLVILLLKGCVAVRPYEVVSKSGRYGLAGATRCAELYVDEGEILVLRTLPGGTEPRYGVNVTGLAWVNDRQIIYSTSAVYGTGGILTFDFDRKVEQWIVPSEEPRALDQLNGYFKLVSVSSDEIRFWFAADFNRIDESDLERTAGLKTVKWSPEKKKASTVRRKVCATVP